MSLVQPLYGSSVPLTVTALNGLGSDASLLAGWSSAVIDNTSNLSDDEYVTGSLKANASSSLTAGTFAEIWAWSILDDTPTYPDTITGSQGAVTLTSGNVKLSGAFKPLGIITFDTNTNRVYPFTFQLSQTYGQLIPKKWGIFITQSSGQTLNASGNLVTRIPVQLQIV